MHRPDGASSKCEFQGGNRRREIEMEGGEIEEAKFRKAADTGRILALSLEVSLRLVSIESENHRSMVLSPHSAVRRSSI